MEYNTTFEVMSEIYKVISGDNIDNYSKYEVAIKILNVVEDYEASEHTGKDPKNVTMNLFTNGDERYYTFSESLSSGDFLEGNIKISGIIPAGQYRGFVVNNGTTLEAALILVGTNYSGQSISIVKNDDKWINK